MSESRWLRYGWWFLLMNGATLGSILSRHHSLFNHTETDISVWPVIIFILYIKCNIQDNRYLQRSFHFKEVTVDSPRWPLTSAHIGFVHVRGWLLGCVCLFVIHLTPLWSLYTRKLTHFWTHPPELWHTEKTQKSSRL